jgi:hypothetical protein
MQIYGFCAKESAKIKFLIFKQSIIYNKRLK